MVEQSSPSHTEGRRREWGEREEVGRDRNRVPIAHSEYAPRDLTYLLWAFLL